MRALSLAKYLPAFGFQVHVLSAANAVVPVRDPGLLAHVPPSVAIHRAFTPELPFQFRKRLWSLVSRPKAPSSQSPSAESRPHSRLANLARRIFSPDPQVVWVPFAIRAARRIIRRHGIQAVLVTAPPFSTFLIGNALKASRPQIKLISDFRDEWLRFYLTDFDFLRSDFTRRRAEQIESRTVSLSDLVVAVTESSLSEIRSRYPSQPAPKFALVHNGYDPDTLRPLFEQSLDGAPSAPREKVVITHVGTAYRTASPAYYLNALDGLPPDIRGRIETRFIGRVSETEERLLASRGPSVRLLGFLPQAEALRYIAETDYLLLTMINEFSLPGKLFEYLASGKPILALSPPGGEVARLIAESGAGWCAPHDDPEAVRRILTEAVRCALDGSIPFRTRRDVVSRFERPRLVAGYARLIRERLFPETLSADAID